MADIRTQYNADAIVQDLSEGVPLRQICRDLKISFVGVYDWMKADKPFAERIACARVSGYDAIAEDILDIADDKGEDPASRRIRTDVRLKLLAKWDPKRYGDKMALVGGGEGDEPIKTRLDVGALTEEQLAVIAAIRLNAG